MSNEQKRDATCLATESDGDLMGNQLPTTSQSIDLKREGTVCVIGKDWVLIKKRRCSNANISKKVPWRCNRPAQDNRQRCELCARSAIKSNRKNWMRRAIQNCKDKDSKKAWNEAWEQEDYINIPWLKKYLKKNDLNCFWCGRKCQLDNRQANTGLQVERLNNDLPHVRYNCVLCCGLCNRQSHYASFDRIPHNYNKYITQYNQPMQWSVPRARQTALLCLEVNHLLGRTPP